MSLLHRNKLELKLGDYGVGQANALTDQLLVGVAQDYRRYVASRMMPLDPTQIVKRVGAADYHVSLKIDGEFAILVYDNGEAILVNPGGTVRAGLPLLKEAVTLLQATGIDKAVIAGELYYGLALGKRPRVHDVCRVARQPNSQAELEGLRFAAFDVIEVNDTALTEPYEQTLARLNNLFQGGKFCSVVETVRLKDGVEIAEHFKKLVDGGAEGIVVRSEAMGIFKIKPRHTLDAVVIGFTEGTEDRRGMIHDLLLAVMRADGNLQVLGHVGGGFTVEERQGFLSDLKDRLVKSDYVEVNEQVAYHMVRPDIVVEISVLELISQTTRGLPIKTMVLDWDSKEQCYKVVRRLPLVSPISPQFVRRREDKQLNVVDIRIQQVSDLVEVPLVDRDSRQLSMPTSRVLRREVCTKEMKGALMVRKLVMWQTNKQGESDEYPAYVIHYTDYSPNRKTPLEREVRVSSSPEQIEQLWYELAAEAFVKGWTLVTPRSLTEDTAMPPTAPLVTDKPAPKKKAAKKV